MTPEPTNKSAPPVVDRRAQQSNAPIDLQRLADKVYQLMIAEVRLEQARGMKRQER